MDSKKLRAWVDERIQEVLKDERYQSGKKRPANVQINAPLALIQCSLESRIGLLRELEGFLNESQAQ